MVIWIEVRKSILISTFTKFANYIIEEILIEGEDMVKKFFVKLFWLIIVITFLSLLFLGSIYLIRSSSLTEVYQTAFIGGLLSAYGGIIGGLITFYGVVLTLRDYRSKDILDSYPRRIIASDDLKNFLENFLIFLETKFNYGSMGIYEKDLTELEKYLKNFLKQDSSNLKQKSILISRKSFYLFKEIEFNVGIYLNKYSDTVRVQSKDPIWGKDIAVDWVEEIRVSSDGILREIELLDKNYVRTYKNLFGRN
jgi:hypothetical protein